MRNYLGKLYRSLRRENSSGIEVRVRNIMKILDAGHGNKASYSSKKSIDGEGNPIPWFTYPAIEYLKQLDLQALSILEWGIGNSTLFFAQRCREIISIEHNKNWFDSISSLLPANAKGVFVDEEHYHNYPLQLDKKFDIIIVDGIKRRDCLSISLSLLSERGFILFDNSDRNPDYCEFLRSRDLIQVDFHGFGPIVDFTTTTSIFFSRKFNIKPLTRQPMIPIGGGY